ncbi:helix-turn-helix domain-containing protein (plasmid) [Segnochrobactraceae bacterium EtOH-i3]
MPEEKRFYSVTEAAEMLGLSSQSLYDSHKRGLIRFGKLLSRFVVPASELRRILAEAEGIEPEGAE